MQKIYATLNPFQGKGLSKIAYATLFFVAIATCAFAQSEKKIKATVQKAIVYQQGAQLFSSESVVLPSGTTEVVFENVSPYLDVNSLQAACKGDAVVMDVRYNVKYAEPEKIVDKSIPESTMKRYEREMKTVRDSLKELEFWQLEINQRSQYLQSERTILTGNRMMQGNLQKDSLALFIRALEYLRARINIMDTEIIKLSREQNKLYTQKNALEQRVNDITMLMSGTKKAVNTAAQPITQIIVTVNAEAAQSSEISINYFVAQAGWTPSYDLRAAKESPMIELKHRASVYQQTGVDWKNVSLVLSTGNPNQNNERPVLNPFFVGFDAPIAMADYGYPGSQGKKKSQAYNNYQVSNSSNIGQEQAAASSMDTSVSPLDGMQKERLSNRDLNEFINVNENMLRVEYDISLKYSIESDGKARNVTIQTKSIPTTYTYSVIPKLDPDVFLMARITDWEDMNLVPGAARVYFDNSFIGTSFINPRNTNDTLQLNFGRDKSIVVNRIKVKDKCREKLLNDNKFSAKTYEITIRNTKNAPIRLIVEDQMPVTKEPDIKIEYTENSNATKFNTETGKLTWDLTIKSKDNKKLTFSYEVKHPKDKAVSAF
jgi:uncharacterized protein (TIGR02231 family)